MNNNLTNSIKSSTDLLSSPYVFSEKSKATSLHVELVSFLYGATSIERRKAAIEIINNTKADIVVFCGHTLGKPEDLDLVVQSNTNEHTVSFLEVKKTKEMFFLQGKTLYPVTKQIFTSSDDIDETKANFFLQAMLGNRTFVVKGRVCRIIMCGENNILRNFNDPDKPIEFRYKDDEQLSATFSEMICASDIIFNPIHTPQGNQGKIERRRWFFSADGRYYFSTSNTKDYKDRGLNRDETKLEASVQYSYHNSKRIFAVHAQCTRIYKSQIFEVN